MNMKKNKFLLLIVGLLLILNSCKKDGGNPLSSYDNFKQGAYIYLDAPINLNFNYAALANSAVGVKVKKYLNGVKIDSLILYASATATTDKTKWKLVSATKFTADSFNLTCTGAQLASALGVNINSFSAGSQYFFYNRIVTSEGLSYDISNTLGALEPTTNAYKACFRWSAFITCPYNADDLFGVGNNSASFRVVADGWEDWGAGSVVKVYRGSKANPTLANTISITDVYGSHLYITPVAGSYSEVLINMDPATGTARIPGVPAVQYSNGGTIYWARGSGYTVANGDGPSGYVFSCTGYIGVNINWYAGSLTGTNYGSYALKLQKL